MIFVHELGHFLVAKLCGVKCEKFYLGFDIGGLKFCKFRWGETEYGIGILPLGGYVKMLGQEDNPARIREEMERAKARGGGDRRVKGRGPEASAAARSAPGDGHVSGQPVGQRRSPSPPSPLSLLPSSIRAVSWPRACRSGWPSSRPA